MINSTDSIRAYFAESARLLGRLDSIAADIRRAADTWIDALASGGKVMFCGNGGSAADSQHLAAELMGRFLSDRAPLPALALTVDTSALTAIGNDYGFEHVFARQLRGIGRKGDVLVGLSTSGNSANVVKAFEAARQMGITSIAFTGASRGALGALSDVLVAVPHEQTSHIQEAFADHRMPDVFDLLHTFRRAVGHTKPLAAIGERGTTRPWVTRYPPQLVPS